MTREELSMEFAGITHDHLMVNKQEVLLDSTANNRQFQPQMTTHKNLNTAKRAPEDTANEQDAVSALSTIAILRRNPMYDSLVLSKRYRACLNGFTLEFPTSNSASAAEAADNHHPVNRPLSPVIEHSPQKKTAITKGSDCCKTKLVSVYLDGDDPIYQCNMEHKSKTNASALLAPEGELVYVPMNGLLERLDNYDRMGVAIDSRVYAFAMGLKTAEKFLTTNSMKELQETPPI